MRRRALRIAAVGAGIAGLFLLSGCVYLRLLKTKNQLRDFDAHFELGGRPSWDLDFKTPVLNAKDVVFLIGADPLSTGPGPFGEVYDYSFEIVRSTPQASTVLDKLSLRVHVDDEGKLRRIEVPETFLLYFSRHVLEATLRKAGDAEVWQARKMARVTVPLSKEVEAELPSLRRTRLLLGEPLDEKDIEGLRVLAYRYRIAGDPTGVPIIARFRFGPDGLMRRAAVTWGASTADATFVSQ
jgi:hypothetical protein